MLATGTGTIDNLPNVICIPTMDSHGLMSIRQIIDDSSPDVQVLFTKDSVTVGTFSTATVLAKGPRIGNLYHLSP